tara:strand:+ start:744 stop:962 length:219 start_codon:yes stop_codon:yes gene_type:complete
MEFESGMEPLYSTIKALIQTPDISKIQKNKKGLKTKLPLESFLIIKEKKIRLIKKKIVRGKIIWNYLQENYK